MSSKITLPNLFIAVIGNSKQSLPTPSDSVNINDPASKSTALSSPPSSIAVFNSDIKPELLVSQYISSKDSKASVSYTAKDILPNLLFPSGELFVSPIGLVVFIRAIKGSVLL